MSQYLFGDSTQSSLKTNFLEFLRDAIDFSVFVLQADARIKQGRARMRALRQEADAEFSRLEVFVGTVTTAIEQAPKGPPGSPTAECAAHLTALSVEALRNFLDAARQKLAADIAHAEAEETAEREACTAALARLLAPHDPPDASTVARIELDASGAYQGSLAGNSRFGLTWKFELAIPTAHFWSAPLRIERLLPVMEIRTPQVTGWLSKEVKTRPQRLERQMITELVDDGEAVRLKLRQDAGADSGFDLEVEPEAKRVTMARVGSKDDAAGAFEVHAEDVPKLLELVDKLRAGQTGLERHQLDAASIDGVEFQAQETFTGFVEQLVSMMAPIVRDISQRSLMPNELVIRRMLSNDRREEIFVAKAALREKFAALPDALRAFFAPLDLEAGGGARSVQPPSGEPPAVRSELAPSQPPPPIKPSSPPRAEPGIAATPPIPSPPRSSLAGPPPLPPSIGAAPPKSATDAAPDAPITTSELGRVEGQGPTNEVLVTALKRIVGLVKKGSTDDAYGEYSALFSSRAFADYRPEDQRQALRLMVLAKTPARTGAIFAYAHRAAVERLKVLVDKLGEPADYELLGVGQMALNDSAAASKTFAAALALERARNPNSELCGSLMRRVSAL